MATLGTATILIEADDRQLQSVLSKMPQLINTATQKAQTQATKAFNGAGIAAARAFNGTAEVPTLSDRIQSE